MLPDMFVLLGWTARHHNYIVKALQDTCEMNIVEYMILHHSLDTR